MFCTLSGPLYDHNDLIKNQQNLGNPADASYIFLFVTVSDGKMSKTTARVWQEHFLHYKD